MVEAMLMHGELIGETSSNSAQMLAQCKFL
jgi:hypothetical protein